MTHRPHRKCLIVEREWKYMSRQRQQKTGDDDMTTMMTQKMARQKNDLAVSA